MNLSLQYRASAWRAGILVLVSAATAVPVRATEAPAVVEQLEPVAVQLKRDASLLPYARLNALLAGLRQHGEGLFRIEFRIALRDPAPGQAAPKLAIQHADDYIVVPVAADGLIELPILPQAQAEEADLATNQPKGSLSLMGKLQLPTAPGALDLATVRRIVAVGKTLRSELLPWYARWLFPQVDGVRICSAAPAWELEWREQGQLLGLPLKAEPGDRDPETKKGATSRPCTTLTGQENWPDAARLVAPAGTTLSVRLGR